ncbi:Fur family transcriptional regulator [Nocardioides mesophilus]|uniref:Transcriptional repressor n=1 Tax=Nocardioides mesophilus TaxID=433659 RepID=A0A7G9RB80_9ACTN|nr:Fur family transcriptional regulator [Nocardioides mesophilus]QNN52855.1 transcriptional repressor [Nocardioides mesophilus]
MPPADPGTADLLREQGLRVTRQRLAVLAALEAAPHSDADAVIGRVRGEIGPVSTQAVYDVLNTLTDKRLLRRIQPAGSTARYELRVGDNHHHVVCRGCGAVADVGCATGVAPCLETSELPLHAPGFVVDEAEVTFWGRCATCLAAEAG